MNTTVLTLGHVARQAGVNVETLRDYQRRGLITEPPKPAYGYRNYPPATVSRVQFIKRAQGLGFSLREIAELLSLGDGNCEDVCELAERKCAEIDTQIAALDAIKGALQQLRGTCSIQTPDTRCPIIEALTRSTPR